MLDLATVRSLSLEVLQAHGWTAVEPVAIAEKKFATAVGVKVAHIYLHDHDGYNFSMHGDYLSEGNNVLACGTLVPVEVDADEVKRLAAEFCQNAERRIDQSYARNLYLKYDVQ